MSKQTNERRTIATEIRIAEAAGKAKRVTGLAAVFDSRSEDLGGFIEIVKPGAFTRSLKEGGDVIANVEHDPATKLGRTKHDTLGLEENRHGLGFDLELPQTTLGADTAEQVRRGDLDGCSFEFRVRAGGEDWEELEDGTILRTLTDIDLRAITLTAYPAYPATDVALRSLEAWRAGGEASERRKRLLRLAMAAQG